MVSEQNQTDESQENPVQQQPPGEILMTSFMLVVVAILFAASLKLPGVFQGEMHGAGSVPQLVTLTGLLLLIFEWINVLRKRGVRIPWQVTGRYLFSKPVLILGGAVLIYIFILEWLHFSLTTVLFLWGCMYALDRRRPVYKLVISLITVGGLYAVFSLLFQVMLP